MVAVVVLFALLLVRSFVQMAWAIFIWFCFLSLQDMKGWFADLFVEVDDELAEEEERGD